MLRRGYALLLAQNSLKTVEKSVSTNPAVRRVKIEVATDVVKNFKPSATVAPNLLEIYSGKKTVFGTPKSSFAASVQLFAASCAVGSAVIFFIYYIVGGSIADDIEREYIYADGIRDSNERHEVLLKEFVAPSSYKYLQEKMIRKQEERREHDVVQASVLHSEVVYRMKIWWNRQLTLLDSVLSRFLLRQKARSEASTIASAVAVRGYLLVKLENQE